MDIRIYIFIIAATVAWWLYITLDMILTYRCNYEIKGFLYWLFAATELSFLMRIWYAFVYSVNVAIGTIFATMVIKWISKYSAI